jgi:dTDP-4-amino-4,6-dideoxygalactose transaminase
MDSMKIPLSATWFDQHELDRVGQALAGRVAGDGPFCEKVERRLERLLGVPRVLLTTSCTHALELALMALGVGPGQEVVCPSFTFVSTANAVLRVGARPVFADIEPEGLGLDPQDVERRLTERTRALLPVHYAGLAPYFEPLLALARERGLVVVEDAAQAFGATLRGQPLGSLGDAGCFSFHETKNLTCGEGGALALRDEEAVFRAEVIREKGTNRRAFVRGIVKKYTWVAEGSSYVLSDILAAVLDAQLDKAEPIARRRRQITELYRRGLSSWAAAHGVRLPAQSPDCCGNDHIFFLLFPEESQRDRCLRALRSQGIGAAFHYIPLHSSPFGASLGVSANDLPVTDRVSRTLLRLPLHPRLENAEASRIIDIVTRSLLQDPTSC